VKIPVRVSSVVRGFTTSRLLAAGAIGSAPALAVRSWAGDYSAQPADSLIIAGSKAWVLAQPTSERERLSYLYVSGRGPDQRFKRRLNRYPALTRAGNKVAVT
jgi:hypothetical protein